jgi:hypothetical protein
LPRRFSCRILESDGRSVTLLHQWMQLSTSMDARLVCYLSEAFYVFIRHDSDLNSHSRSSALYQSTFEA